jgi:hypothetical protein
MQVPVGLGDTLWRRVEFDDPVPLHPVRRGIIATTRVRSCHSRPPEPLKNGLPPFKTKPNRKSSPSRGCGALKRKQNCAMPRGSAPIQSRRRRSSARTAASSGPRLPLGATRVCPDRRARRRRRGRCREPPGLPLGRRAPLGAWTLENTQNLNFPAGSSPALFLASPTSVFSGYGRNG